MTMVKEAKTKIYKTDSRHTLYLQKDLVNDSAFPFKPNEELIIKIENDTLVITRSKDS
jgi:hypothetical protein